MKKTNVFALIIGILTAVTAIVYAFAKARENSPIVIALLAAAAVVEIVIALKPVDYVEYVPFALSLAGLTVFLRLAFDEIGDIVSSVNTEGLSVSWIISTALIIVVSICAGVNTVLSRKK